MKILAASAVMLCAAGVAGGPQDSRPLSIALLVDVTASLHLCPGGIAGAPSTAGQGLGSTLATSRAVGDIPPAVAEFRLDGIEPRDRIRVAAIGRHLIWMGTVVEGDSPDLKKNWHNVFALPPIEWLGPSPIWDAVGEVAAWAAAQSPPAQVVLVSDGQATANVHGIADVIAIANQRGVKVSIVAEAMPQAVKSRTSDPVPALRRLAESTGGVFELDEGRFDELCVTRQPSRHLKQVLEALRR